MPLIKGKSNKAFEHNLKTEMHAGKPQDQALAIAYSVKRKNQGKKMAKGGEVTSAATEKRPMPSDTTNDSAEVSRNSERKTITDSQMTGVPQLRQARKPSLTPLSRPKILGSDTFSVRDRAEIEAEERKMSSEAPASPKQQPSASRNEKGPDRQGPPVPDMSDEHSTGKKPYAKGGKVEASDYRSPINKYEQDFTELTPSEDEGAAMARAHDEEGQDRQGPDVPDMEAPHNGHQRKPYAGGGGIDRIIPDSGFGKIIVMKAEGGEVSPEDEIEEEHHASIAAAIMAKRERQSTLDSDSDEDQMVRMADGGILSHDSIYSDDSSQVDLSRNADEDANEEDQLSFNALRKENYSESEGLRKLNQPEDSNLKGDEREDEESDKHDMISAIRSKMNSRRNR